MNALLDRARRAAHRAAGRARRRLSGGDDDGFVLLESIIAISLITFIMAAVGVEFVSGVAAVARQRATQSAAQIADSTMSQIRALKPSDLVTGRGVTSVQTQFAQGNAIATISPWLQKMDQASDTGAAPNDGANATIPTCDPTPRPTAPATCTQKPSTVAYTVAQFLGTCWVDTSTTSSPCVPAAQKTTASVQYLRAVVAVSWTASTCSPGCYYLSSTLISADPDPTFRANQPPPPSPAIIVPGDQTSHIGDNVALQLSLQMGTGIPAYTWDLAAGSLPAGLTLNAGGRISGTVRGPASSTRVTVRITDGYGRQDTATFTWAVLSPPPVSACPSPVTLANPSFETPVVAAGAGSNVANGTAGLGWKTTSVTGQIEFWSNGGSSQSSNSGTAITAKDGSQWVEVNGSGMDTLYQDLPTTPGQVLQWSLWHRARNSTNDVTAQDSIQVQMGSTTKPTAQVPSGATAPTISDGASDWVQYTGTYTVPAAQTTTRFQVAATATSSGSTSVGNFVDNVRVAGVPCLSPAAQSSTVNTAIRPLQLQADQGSGSVTWSDDGGTLPAGLSLSASGLITGTPTTVGITQVQLVLIDQVSGYQQLVPFTWVVYAAPSVSVPANQSSSVGRAVNLAVNSSCPNVPCTYSAANLPAGLTINAITGVVSGTPTTTGTTNPTLTITDAAGATFTTTPFSWAVKAAPTLATPGNQRVTIGVPVTLSIVSTCSNVPCSYSVTPLPGGLSFDSNTSAVTGTPTATGTTSSTVTVRDSAGATATGSFTWTVLAAPTVTTPANQTTTVGATVNLTVGSSCPNTPCTYSATNLPPGLTVAPGTGTITGSPTTAGTTTSTVTIRDASGATGTSGTFTWTVKALPNVTTPVNQTTTVGATVSVTLTSSCPNSPCTYSATNLPAGLTLAPGTGTITGSPTTVGTSTVTVTVTDASGVTSTSGSFTWTVKAAPTVTSPGNQTTTVGAAVNVTVGSTCANGPCTYTLNNPPAGLRMTGAVITGTLTTAGTTTSTVTVTDASGVTATSGPFTWTVKAAPTVTSPGNQTTTIGAAVNVTVGSTCANGPCAYTLNNPPVGLRMTGAVITGTPTTAGTTTSTVTVTDASGVTATTGSFTWTVVTAPTITTPGNQTTTVGATVNLTTVSSCPNGPCTYTATNLPAGLTLAPSTGAITGSPTVVGTSTVTITVTDASGVAATTGSFTWTVLSAPTITTPGTQTTTVGATVNLTTVSSCPNGPCSYTATTLPAGLSINAATGAVTGTPTTAGTTTSSITITDAAGVTRTTGSFTWNIKAAPSIATPANQTAGLGGTVNLAVTSTCPNTPCTFTASTLPTGLSINAATGTVTGTPTTAGTTTSSITITDAAGVTRTTGNFTWTISAASSITTPGNQSTTVGAAVNLTVTSTCARTPCTFTTTALPAGLSINAATGTVTGTPTTAGVTSVTITVRDAAGSTASATFTWTVYARPTITSPGNQTNTVNTALILPISSTCPNTPCTYALSGAPAGLTINNRRITGSPTATGTSPAVKVTVTDAGGVAVDTTTFSWTVVAGPSVTSPGNQISVNNSAVSLTLTRSCPNSPCAYRLDGGPAGLSISSAGVVSGKITSAPQTFSGVTVTVTDSSGATATTSAFTWTVTAPLAGRWAFDEPSGQTAADSSGAGHDAQLTGNYGRTGAAAQGANAITMGTGGAAATAGGTVLDTSGSFTVAAWVRLTSTSTTQTFVSQDGTLVSAFALQYDAGAGRFVFSRTASDSLFPATTSASAISAPTVGQWYHITGVHDPVANTLTLYVNGVQQGTPVAYSTGWNAAGAGKFVIGRGKVFGFPTNSASAAIDDVRAYSSVLSADAISQLPQALYWPFDEGSGTKANDSSLANVDGTLSGGASRTTGVVGANAVQLNGSTGAVTGTGPAIDTSQSFTITAYAKADAATANGSDTGTVVSLDGTNVSAFGLVATGGRWTLARPSTDSTSSPITVASATSTITADQWYQLTAVFDSVGDTLSLYVNGVRQGAPVSFTTGFEGSGPFVVGRSKIGTAGYYFGGAIDEVQAFQFAADQPTVNALSSLTPPTPSAPTAAAGASSATVSWTAPDPIAGNATTGYVVTPYLDGVAQQPVSFNSTATSQTLTGLTTGGSYTFAVAAVNTNGASAASPVSGSVLVS